MPLLEIPQPGRYRTGNVKSPTPNYTIVLVTVSTTLLMVLNIYQHIHHIFLNAATSIWDSSDSSGSKLTPKYLQYRAATYRAKITSPTLGEDRHVVLRSAGGHR